MLTFVAGTRPEFVKLRPVVTALSQFHPDTPWQVVCTHQHTDLITEFLADPIWASHLVSANLDTWDWPATSNDPVDYVWRLHLTLEFAIKFSHASTVVVQGDTASALAGARAAHSLRLPLAHVEAGIRSHDLTNPWPEESFRVEISQLAQWHYAPSPANATILRVEGIPADQILLVGNPGLDRLAHYPRGARHPRVLVTLHRRESFGLPLRRILAGLADAAVAHPEVDFLWPVHPNPAVQQASHDVQFHSNIYRLPPLPSDTFTALLASSLAVLTDSGGVQEEAAFLGIPCVVARLVTDRPESVQSGHALLAGHSPAQPLHLALTNHLHTTPFLGFGDGHTGPRIATHLATTAALSVP